MIAIIDYGMGNLRSVQKALEKVGAQTLITEKVEDIQRADKVVLPGVGAMQPAMAKLESLGLIEPIKQSISDGTPFLGICLGFQLLFETSDEGGNVQGLGILKGSIKRFTALKVPHMGWNQLDIQEKDCPLLSGIDNLANVYFCHSYFVNSDNEDIILTLTDYGIKFASAVHKDNIFAVQFHPEKSQEIGLKILRNFTQI